LHPGFARRRWLLYSDEHGLAESLVPVVQRSQTIRQDVRAPDLINGRCNILDIVLSERIGNKRRNSYSVAPLKLATAVAVRIDNFSSSLANRKRHNPTFLVSVHSVSHWFEP
jgi:hypothetical protein